MKIFKILLFKIILLCNIYVYSIENNSKNNSKNIIKIELGKCKKVAQRRVIEFTSLNESVVSIEKDILSNKICLKAKKLGSSKVSMLLFDGSGSIVWNVQVVMPSVRLRRKAKELNSSNSLSTFDKELGISRKQPGWK